MQNISKMFLGKTPYWVHPFARIYYKSLIIPYGGRLVSKSNVQKNDVINELLFEYQKRTPIDKTGLETLYDRAQNRGYMPKMIYIGLKTLICKNYMRKEYIPPDNDPLLEVIHERIYMQDAEFRSLFKSQSA